MRKLIWLIILMLFAVPCRAQTVDEFNATAVANIAEVDNTAAANIAEINAVTFAADPCAAMGASGTYELWWNGEYESDTDKACRNSGAATEDGTYDAGVINSSSPLSGSYDFKTTADNDSIYWTADSDTDEVFTVEAEFKVPSSTTGNNALFVLWADSNDNWVGYLTATGILNSRYENEGNVEYVGCSNGLTDGVQYTIAYSVNISTDQHCVKVAGVDCGSGSGAWECETESGWGAFTDSPTEFHVGDSGCPESPCLVTDTGYQIDDVKVAKSFQASF